MEFEFPDWGYVVLVVIVLVALIATSGCSIRQATDVTALTGDVILLSTRVDDLQADLGKYAENQNMLEECDRLQQDITAALKGDIGKARLYRFQLQAQVIYEAVKHEVVQRWQEIPPSHQTELVLLERDYLSIRSRITSLQQSVIESGEYNQLARDVLAFVAALSRTYVLYAEMK